MTSCCGGIWYAPGVKDDVTSIFVLDAHVSKHAVNMTSLISLRRHDDHPVTLGWIEATCPRGETRRSAGAYAGRQGHINFVFAFNMQTWDPVLVALQLFIWKRLKLVTNMCFSLVFYTDVPIFQVIFLLSYHSHPSSSMALRFVPGKISMILSII